MKADQKKKQNVSSKFERAQRSDNVPTTAKNEEDETLIRVFGVFANGPFLNSVDKPPSPKHSDYLYKYVKHFYI